MKKPTERKLIHFKDMTKTIQDYADKCCGGNFTFAVRRLVEKGLNNDRTNG